MSRGMTIGDMLPPASESPLPEPPRAESLRVPNLAVAASLAAFSRPQQRTPVMIVLRLIAFLLRRRVVKLLDTKGDVRLTITRSRHHSWADEQRAWVNPLSRVGSVTLLDDGSCGGRASGFVGWKYY